MQPENPGKNSIIFIFPVYQHLQWEVSLAYIAHRGKMKKFYSDQENQVHCKFLSQGVAFHN